jgi:hypothetical protein
MTVINGAPDFSVFKRMRLYKNKHTLAPVMALQINTLEDKKVLSDFLEVDSGTVLIKNATVSDYMVLSSVGLSIIEGILFTSSYDML